MNLINKVIILFIFISPVFSNSSKEVFLYFSKKEIIFLKHSLNTPTPKNQLLLNELQKWSDELLKKGPWSIADFPSHSISIDQNDYYSESPYWWPDPDNPTGPYIRRDGERNPNRFMEHKAALQKMTQASTTLILSGYLFGNQKYIDHALKILNKWFIDPGTRMNPNMDYAQAIPNKSTGRGVGIIDVHNFVKLIEAFYILDLSQSWPENHKIGITNWFSEFLNWLTTSKNGLDEKFQGNNHTTWWCALVAGISQFVGNDKEYRIVYEYVIDEVIPNQIESDGSMPHEEKRTKSMSYVNFNLEAFSLLLQNFSNRGLDIWALQNTKGGSVKKAIDYIYPYTIGEKKWVHKQITALKNSVPVYWYFAGEKYSDRTYSELFINKNNISNLKEMGAGLDPFLLFTNLLASAKFD